MVEDIVTEYKTFLKTSHLVDLSLPMHVYMSAYEEDGLQVSVSVSSLIPSSPVPSSEHVRALMGILVFVWLDVVIHRSCISTMQGRAGQEPCLAAGAFAAKRLSQLRQLQADHAPQLGQDRQGSRRRCPPCLLFVLCRAGTMVHFSPNTRSAVTQTLPGRTTWSSRSACRPLPARWAAMAARSWSCQWPRPLDHRLLLVKFASPANELCAVLAVQQQSSCCAAGGDCIIAPLHDCSRDMKASYFSCARKYRRQVHVVSVSSAVKCRLRQEVNETSRLPDLCRGDAKWPDLARSAHVS